MDFDLSKKFEYENGFYLTASVDRISKFATHLELFRRVSGIAGDIVECGVFKGASLSRLIKFRALFENPYSKKIIAFDTFATFPEAGYEPDRAKREGFVREAGDRSIGHAELIELLDALSLNQNIELIEGDILETVPEYCEQNPELRVSLLHIDVDLYEPTAKCLEWLYPRVTRGGIAILDDYGKFPGANKAIDEFFSGEKVRVQKLPYSCEISFVEKG